MKKTAIYLMLCLFAVSSIAYKPATTKLQNSPNVDKAAKIEVYYFHFTRRCVTCNAVESVTKDALNEYFAKEMKDGKIVFTSVNLDDDSNKAIAERLKVSGQSLLFVAGTVQKDLTNDGFMYAKSTPDKLKAKVKATVNDLLK